MEWNGEGYEPVNISDPLPSGNVMKVGQADTDPELEIFFGTDTHLHIYEARDRHPSISLAIPYVSAIAPGDVDADGEIEVVVAIAGSSLEVYDIATGALEQSYPGWGGLSPVIGQADADPALEIAGSLGFYVGVIDGVTGMAEPGVPSFTEASIVRWIDLDSDGVDELIFSEWDVLTAWSLVDDAQVWQVEFPSRIEGLQLAQADLDAQQELAVSFLGHHGVFGAGRAVCGFSDGASLRHQSIARLCG